MNTYTIPVIDGDTGERYDIEVNAEDPQSALDEVPDNAYVTHSFIDEHFDVDAPSNFDIEPPDIVEE